MRIIHYALMAFFKTHFPRWIIIFALRYEQGISTQKVINDFQYLYLQRNNYFQLGLEEFCRFVRFQEVNEAEKCDYGARIEVKL